jgi:precorrin-6A/cobalt-precorrin-6A reductase
MERSWLAMVERVETAQAVAERVTGKRLRVLLLGGTKEAAELASMLVAEGHDVTTSLAGRTREPAPLAGAVRIGGFGGAGGLAAFLTEHRFDLLVDATHPFAGRISANAAEAASLTALRLIRLERKRWERSQGDDWHEVATLEEASTAIPAGARVLLALGSQHIAAFAARPDVFFLVRMVDPPPAPLALAHHRVIAARPGDVASEQALLEAEAISHIVCRNSGGSGAYAKIAAARALRLPVIMIR